MIYIYTYRINTTLTCRRDISFKCSFTFFFWYFFLFSMFSCFALRRCWLHWIEVEDQHQGSSTTEMRMETVWKYCLTIHFCTSKVCEWSQEFQSHEPGPWIVRSWMMAPEFAQWRLDSGPEKTVHSFYPTVLTVYSMHSKFALQIRLIVSWGGSWWVFAWACHWHPGRAGQIDTKNRNDTLWSRRCLEDVRGVQCGGGMHCVGCHCTGLSVCSGLCCCIA